MHICAIMLTNASVYVLDSHFIHRGLMYFLWGDVIYCHLNSFQILQYFKLTYVINNVMPCCSGYH